MSGYKQKATEEEKKIIQTYCRYINWFFVGFVVFLLLGLVAVWYMDAILLAMLFLIVGFICILSGVAYTTKYCVLRVKIKKR